MFLMEIVFSFNTAFYSEDFEIIDSRKEIARNYLNGWFIIDLFAIIPFEFIFWKLSNLGQYNGAIKIIRLCKIYKLIKLSRLVKLMKVFKSGNTFFNLLFKYI